MKYRSILFFFGFVSILIAQEPVLKEIVMGGPVGWDILAHSQGLVVQEEKGGQSALLLKKASWLPPSADFSISFELNEASSSFILHDSVLRMGAPYARAGAYSGYFRGKDLLEVALPAQVLTAANLQETYTIELWAYPVSLVEGAQLFYWEGWARDHKQQVYAEMRQGKIVWALHNLFFDEEGNPHSYTLESDYTLVPETWSHHALRFHQGLLEYSMDAIPQDLYHVTETAREDAQLHFLQFGDSEHSIEIGKGWVGLIDNFSIHREEIDPSSILSESYELGIALTEPLYLGPHGGIVERVAFQGSHASHIGVSYRLASFLHSESPQDAVGLPWRALPASGLINEEGRYLQLRFELYGHPSFQEAPSLSSARVAYHSFAALSPPAQVYVEAGDAEVFLRWTAVEDERVDGYRVYFGKDRIFLQGEEGIPSPIDVGLGTQAKITGLVNTEGYFFSVASYHRGIEGEEVLSPPVFARPLFSP